jgi:hypothetical protein
MKGSNRMYYRNEVLANGTEHEIKAFLKDFLQEKAKLQFQEKDPNAVSNIYLVNTDGTKEEYDYSVVVYTHYRTEDGNKVVFNFDVEFADSEVEAFYCIFGILEDEILNDDMLEDVYRVFNEAQAFFKLKVEGAF